MKILDKSFDIARLHDAMRPGDPRLSDLKSCCDADRAFSQAWSGKDLRVGALPGVSYRGPTFQAVLAQDAPYVETGVIEVAIEAALSTVSDRAITAAVRKDLRSRLWRTFLKSDLGTHAQIQGRIVLHRPAESS